MNRTNELFYGSTDTGRIRDNNEDAFIATSLAGRYIVACVIDGVGGYEGGEIAAGIAKETIQQQLEQLGDDPLQQMKDAIILANTHIFSERSKSGRNGNMACVLTLVIADVEHNQFYYAHVGDTRLYLVRDHTLVKITRDHSFVGYLEDTKRLSEQEAMSHPKRNEINKAVGFEPSIQHIADYIETGTSPFLPGDVLLLCSDGLTDMLDSQTIVSVLEAEQTLERKVQSLIGAANAAGGKDNITVVLLKNNNQPTTHEATKPLPKTKNRETEKPVRQKAALKKRESKKNNTMRSILIVLFIVCIGLLADTIWQWKRKPVAPVQQTAQQKLPSATRNTAERALQQNINQSATVVLNDSAFGKSILITDTITVNRDSLHIKGNHIVLQGDTAFRGPVIVAGPQCRYLLLEDLEFENFNKAILTEGAQVYLKNVRFTHCRIPVEHHFLFPDQNYVNGKIIDTLLFKSDSLPKKK